MTLQRSLIATTIAVFAFSSNAMALDAKSELQELLAPISTLQAEFQQHVLDANGELVQELKGALALARPNKFYWHSDAPDELILVADGQAVYYYDPFVEQVTISAQSEAANQSPFLLLLDAEASAWADYEVSNEGLSFQLQPSESAEQQSLQVNFVAKEEQPAQLNELILDDGQGQITRIRLRDVKTNVALPYTTFSFQIPENAVVDDQRSTQ
ncbi:outer membrane lipoprotein chaperone LolA [Pseudidiomarina sp. CB1]|uniref:outer membrane lipoprotein chaperone LolA n=1 Tax=Pseudidiomarina sp. CB1 TaxID=2972484 RepID=UPI002161C17D|nr:outer membrane lipoprotein chaperone LolA [Pseudidiomarina sp. CB1]